MKKEILFGMGVAALVVFLCIFLKNEKKLHGNVCQRWSFVFTACY